MEIIFQSSMPRSGSTLLQNILHQNPLIHATPTDGLVALINATREGFNMSQEFKAQDKNLMEKALLEYSKNGALGYCNSLTKKKMVISKSRGWLPIYDYINLIFDKPKVICIVRDLRDVIASMEKNFRKNPIYKDQMNNFHSGAGKTVLTRSDEWLKSTPVGTHLDFIYDAIIRKIDKNIFFVKYENLCNNPHEEMEHIYKYLNMDNYKHDFNNIKQSTNEDDRVYGVYGDHKIKNVLMPVNSNSEEILGSDAYNHVFKQKEWFFNYFNYTY